MTDTDPAPTTSTASTEHAGSAGLAVGMRFETRGAMQRRYAAERTAPKPVSTEHLDEPIRPYFDRALDAADRLDAAVALPRRGIVTTDTDLTLVTGALREAIRLNRGARAERDEATRQMREFMAQRDEAMQALKDAR